MTHENQLVKRKREKRKYTFLNSCSVAKLCLILQPHGLQHATLLCPWDFPGKNTGVGCHFLLQGIFLTQGSHLHLLPWQGDSLPLSHMGSPSCCCITPTSASASHGVFSVSQFSPRIKYQSHWIRVHAKELIVGELHL